MLYTRPSLLAPIFILLVYVCLSFYRRYAYQRKMRREGCQPIPKYPHTDPFLGLDHRRVMLEGIKRGEVGATRAKIHAKCGHTYEYNVFGQRTVCTMNMDNIRTVVGPSSANFVKPPGSKQAAHPLLTDNLVALDGHEWKQSRSLVMPVLTKEQAVDLPALERHIQKLLKLIPRDGSTVDLQPLFQRLVSGQSYAPLDVPTHQPSLLTEPPNLSWASPRIRSIRTRKLIQRPTSF